MFSQIVSRTLTSPNWGLKTRWILLATLITYVVLWLVSFQELVASDPLFYSMRAFSITQGEALGTYESHIIGDHQAFNHRIGLLYPVAWLYQLLGVSVLSTHLWSLLTTLIIIVVVWCAGLNQIAKISSMIFCLTSVPLFDAATSLYPDISATAFMALSSLILYKRESYCSQKTGWGYSPLAVIFLFVAFLTKLSAYWMLPLWILIFSIDISQKRWNLLRKFYLPALLTGLALGLGYLGYYVLIEGEAFARITAIQSGSDVHFRDWDKRLWPNLTIYPLGVLLLNYGIVFILSLFSLLVLPKTLRFWAYYTVFCLFFFWFGSVSIKSYYLLPRVPRYILPALPGMIILASHFISQISRKLIVNTRYYQQLSIILLVAFVLPPFTKFLPILLITSDIRSAESLPFYFGYSLPNFVTIVYAGDVSKEKYIQEFDRILLVINKPLSEYIERIYEVSHFDDLIQQTDSIKLYDSNNIYVYEPSCKTCFIEHLYLSQ